MTTPEPTIDDRLGAARIEMPGSTREQILGAVSAEPANTLGYHLAQMNTARFRHAMDDPAMAGFVEMLDPINHQADAAPGFLWRLTDEGSNDATSITFYDDPLLLVNISVWTDLDALRTFVYRTEHAAMVKRRGEWADKMDSQYIVLWWVPANHRPSVAEGDAKLTLLREHGPTQEAFTFGQPFPRPES